MPYELIRKLTIKEINMKFNGVRLLVKNFDECFKFYSEKLGLKVTWGELGGVYASFDIGAGPDGLAIFPSDLMAEAVGNANEPFPLTGSREKTMLILQVDNVDKSYKELSAKGIAFITKPTNMGGWGIRTAHLRDPEGNLIELSASLPANEWDKELADEMKKFE